MPAQTRLTDLNTGHDLCPPVPLVQGSPDVFVNKLPAGRLGDPYAAHMCPYHPLHVGHIGEGSPNVFINKLPAGRIGDLVICPAPCYVAEGSPNVFINDIATRDAGKGSLTSATVRAAAKAQPTAKLWKQAGLI